jgi:hypothetical protein
MADTKKPQIVKKTSEKQLIANRMNSKKSTGPRTARGRQRSSMNNLRFGMRSKKDVLPNENAALDEERRQGALKSLAPRNDAERRLVERFVRLEWRGERGERAEKARAALRIHNVIEGAEQREAAEVERLMSDLNKCPENLRLLLGRPAGVRALVREWKTLGDRLASGKTLLGTQRRRCLTLLGKRPLDVLRDDPIATRWVRALVGMVLGAGADPEDVAGQLPAVPTEGMHPTEFDVRVKELAEALLPKKEARSLVLSYVTEELGRLANQFDIIKPLADRNLELEAEEAGADTTPAGARLGQQILASYRGSDAALRRLEALQNPPRRGPGRGAKKAEAPAAAAPAQEPPAPAAPINPEPAQAVAEPTVEAISEPPTVEAISESPTVETTSESPTVEAISEPPTVESISQRRTVEAISEPPTVEARECLESESQEDGPNPEDGPIPEFVPPAAEAIAAPRAVEAIFAEPTSGDDLGPYEPADPELKEIHQEIQEIIRARRMQEGQASAEAVPPGPSAEDEWREQRRKERQERLERLDREQREWREEQARRYETFLANNPERPDPGMHDPDSSGETGRAPPS